MGRILKAVTSTPRRVQVSPDPYAPWPYAHRVRAEKALGKPLPPHAVVHHADGSINEHAPLVICQDQAYHVFLHMRTRIVRAGGDPNTQRICCTCKQLLPLSHFRPSKRNADGRQGDCAECHRRYARRPDQLLRYKLARRLRRVGM